MITKNCSAGAVSAATYANWPVLRYMLRGNTVSDAPLIIGSLDPCYSCTDRVTLVDVRKRQSKPCRIKRSNATALIVNRSPLKVRTEDAEVTENYYARRNRDGEISLRATGGQPSFRGKPDLMPSQCIACGACACPANALTIQTDDQQNSRTPAALSEALYLLRTL